MSREAWTSEPLLSLSSLLLSDLPLSTLLTIIVVLLLLLAAVTVVPLVVPTVVLGGGVLALGPGAFALGKPLFPSAALESATSIATPGVPSLRLLQPSKETTGFIKILPKRIFRYPTTDKLFNSRRPSQRIQIRKLSRVANLNEKLFFKQLVAIRVVKVSLYTPGILNQVVRDHVTVGDPCYRQYRPKLARDVMFET